MTTAMAQVERGTNRIYGIRRDRPGAGEVRPGAGAHRGARRPGRRRLPAAGRAAGRSRTRCRRPTAGRTARRRLELAPAGRSAWRCWCSPSRCCSTTRRGAGSPRCPGWRSAPGISVVLAMVATGLLAAYVHAERLVRRDLRPARRGVRAAAVVAAQLDRAVRGGGGLRPAGVPPRRAAAPGPRRPGPPAEPRRAGLSR